MKYTVVISRRTDETFVIEADTADQAYDKACKGDLPPMSEDYEKVTVGWPRPTRVMPGLVA